MLYWSCESKKIAHGSTCTRIDFLPMVFLLLSFVVVVVCVRRHRSMIPIFSSIFKYLFFSTNQKKSSRREEEKRREEIHISRMFVEEKNIFQYMDIFSLSLFSLFSLFSLIDSSIYHYDWCIPTLTFYSPLLR